MTNNKTQDTTGMKLIREYHTGAKDYKDPKTNKIVHEPAPSSKPKPKAAFPNAEPKPTTPPVEIKDSTDGED